MTTLTKLLLATVLVSATASSVLADNSQFDVDIYRPNIHNNAFDAYAQVPGSGLRAQPRTVRPFSLEEQRWFDKGSASQSN
jgi:hypothetical protein